MTMPEEARKELRDAIRILREDGFHVHRTAEAYAKKLAGEVKPETEEKPEPGGKQEEGNPPPVKEKEEKPPPRDFWFGTRGN